MVKATIVIAAFNRKQSLARCLQALSKAHYEDHSPRLVISIDRGSSNKDIWELAELFHWRHGPKTVLYQEEELGLKRHILACGELTRQYGPIILLEDDIFVSPFFYSYAIQACSYYRRDPRIAGISLYSPRYNETAKSAFEPLQSRYDVFFGQFPSSWGQLWTPEQWASFADWYSDESNLNIRSDDHHIPPNVRKWSRSWKKYFYKYMIEQNKYFVYPYISHSTNFADAGIHVKKPTQRYQVTLSYCGERTYEFCRFDDSAVAYDAFCEFTGLSKQFKEPVQTNLSVDLWATKSKDTYSRFVLTTRRLDCKVLATYSSSMIPLEDNVLQKMTGEGIYLYDTQSKKR